MPAASAVHCNIEVINIPYHYTAISARCVSKAQALDRPAIPLHYTAIVDGRIPTRDGIHGQLSLGSRPLPIFFFFFFLAI